MKKDLHKEELWIGLIKVEQSEKDGVLGDADQAYTNIIGLAKNKIDFRSQIKQAVEELKLQLLRLEDAEPLSVRQKKSIIHKDLSILAKEVKKTGKVAFDVFATFDK